MNRDGFKLARFFPAAQSWEVDYAPFITLAQVLEVEGLAMMVEIDRPGMATRLATALSAHPPAIILSGIDHRTVAEAVALMRAYDSIHLETSTLLATGALKQVIDWVGAERVLSPRPP